MLRKKTKRMLAFLLAFALSVSNISFIYADDGTGNGDGSGREISGGETITENGIYTITPGSTGTIAIDATEVTLVGGGEANTFSSLFIVCNKEKTDLTLQDIWITNTNQFQNTFDFTGADNYLYIKGINGIRDTNKSSAYSMIHVNPYAELTIDCAEDVEETGTLYFNSGSFSPAIGGNRSEANGNITIAGGRIFGVVSKNGPAIGVTSGTAEESGDIRITGGELNLIAADSLNPPLIGGNSLGGKIYISGGLVTLTIEKDDVAIGGENYDVVITGGSVKTYKGWQDTTYDSSEGIIKAKKVNEKGESLYPLTIDTSQTEGDACSISLDGVPYYEGGGYQYGSILEEATNTYINKTGMSANWKPITDNNLYLYAAKGNHKVSINGVDYIYSFNETTQTFENKGVVVEKLRTGTTGNGNIFVSSSEPNAGDTVTVTAAPDEGNYLAQVRYSYTDSEGKTVYQVIKPDSNGAYSFIMPGDMAEVTADFIPVVWDGTIDVTWYDPSATTYNIQYAAQLAGVAAINNGIFNNYPCEENAPATEINGTPKGSTDSLYNVYGAGGNQTAVVGDIKYITAQSGTAEGEESGSSSTYWYGSQDYRGRTINLTADIDMGGTSSGDEYDGASWSGPNYMPIGGQYCMDNSNVNTHLRSTFNGTFNGQGHLVNNIYCNHKADSGNSYDGYAVGLIGHMGIYDEDTLVPYADPDVKNVAADGYIAADEKAGGIVGISTSSESVISSCLNFAMVENGGGIVGRAFNTLTIKSCANFGFIYGGAGICELSNQAQIFDSYNFGSIWAPDGHIDGGAFNGGLGLGASLNIGNNIYAVYEHPFWANCYWFSDTNARGTGDAGDVYFNGISDSIKKITNKSDFTTSAFLTKLNGTPERSLLKLHDFYENKENVKINATGRDWVSGSGAGYISDGIRSALANVKIYKLILGSPSTYVIENVNCATFPVPRTFTQDSSVFTGNINITGAPKTEYISELPFDMNTLKIWAEYSDGTKEAVTDYKVVTETGGEKLTVNDTKVTISGSYKGTSFSYVYTIHVTANQVSSLSIEQKPRNVLYATGESFDKTGMVVKADYTNGDVLEISDYTVTSSPLKYGDTGVIISYTYAGETKKVIQPVTVLDSAAPAIDSQGRVQLASANDMLWFANQVNTGINPGINGILMNDIELSGDTWTPIGKFVTYGSYESDSVKTAKLYEGILDGNGKTITFNNYLIKNTGRDSSGKMIEQPYGGLCALLGSEGVIKNVTVDGSITVAKGIQGAIAGLVYGGIITGCTNNADISSAGTEYGINVAGIAGRVTYGGQILDCVNNGKITSAGSASGIVSQVTTNTLISRCINKGNITASGEDFNYASGIVGKEIKWADGNNHDNEYGTINYCGNEGKISSNYASVGIFGGITDYNFYGSDISYCYNRGAISVASETGHGSVAGICNYSRSNIESCYNSGDLSGDVPGTLYIAGIKGALDSNDSNGSGSYTIKNSYNAGKITAEGGACYAGSIFAGAESENDKHSQCPNILNNYALEGSADRVSSGFDVVTEANAAFVTSDELKALTQTLGEGYREGHISINSGYPLLSWEALGTVELVDKAISELGTITLDSKTALETVRAAYEALTDEEKQYVTKLAILEEAESTYQALKAAADKEAAAGVDQLIENIGTVTLGSKNVIEAARDAYNALDAGQKAYVTKLSILKSAESTYAELAAAAHVDELIENIGTVTLDSKEAIEAARKSYDSLTAGQKSYVIKLSILTAAEERFAKLMQDKEEADKVIAKIEALPASITLSDAKAVEAARTAYDVLTADQRPLVNDYARLMSAEAEISLQKEAMEAAIEKIRNGQGNQAEISMDNLPLLTGDLLEAMKESGKEVTFVKEEGGKVLYSWTFDGSKLNDTNIEIPLGISFTSAYSSAIDSLAGDGNSLYIHFAYHGTLPAPVVVRVYAGDKYRDGNTVNLYYYNDDTGKVEEIVKGLIVKDGYVTFTITHCSDYFLTKTDLAKQAGAADGPQLTGRAGVATGDDVPFIPLTVLMGISFAGIVVLTRRKVCK